MIVGSSDGGVDGEEAPPGLADEVVEFLPRSAEYLIWVDSPESRKAARIAKAEVGVLGNLLGQGFKVSVNTRQDPPHGLCHCLVDCLVFRIRLSF